MAVWTPRSSYGFVRHRTLSYAGRNDARSNPPRACLSLAMQRASSSCRVAADSWAACAKLDFFREFFE